MAKIPKMLQVRFGGFSCTLKGYDDPVQAMKAVMDTLREVVALDPVFAERIGLAALPPAAAPKPSPPPPLTLGPELQVEVPAPPEPPAPFAIPVSGMQPVPELRPVDPSPETIAPAGVPLEEEAPMVDLDAAAAEWAQDEAQDAAPADPAAHPGLSKLLRATSEGDQEEELSRIMSRADDQLADPEAVRRRDLISQLKAAVAATEADRALGEPDPDPATRQGAFRLDLTEAVRTQPSAPSAEAMPLRLVASQRVDLSSPPDLSMDDEEEEGDPLPVQRPESFRAYAAEMNAVSLTDRLEAAAAWLCFVDQRESVSRGQLLALATEALETAPEREEGLRAFGTLLREGRIVSVAGGRYRVSEGSRFHPARLAG